MGATSEALVVFQIISRFTRWNVYTNAVFVELALRANTLPVLKFEARLTRVTFTRDVSTGQTVRFAIHTSHLFRFILAELTSHVFEAEAIGEHVSICAQITVKPVTAGGATFSTIKALVVFFKLTCGAFDCFCQALTS